MQDLKLMSMKSLPLLQERPVRELVVVSGKGGTGKTSIVASLAATASEVVLADCDVDAADLHLVTTPHVIRTEAFSGGMKAKIRSDSCKGCGKCDEACRFNAIRWTGPGNQRAAITLEVDPIGCEGCGVCVYVCEENAIAFEPVVNGRWFLSETRHGPMVHAELGIAEENSGKLVSLIRKEATETARRRGIGQVLIDGSPGIGCPVIASITGADLILVVTEPTLSGSHDAERVFDLADHFHVPAVLCVNKWDLNPAMTAEIEEIAARRGVEPIGRVRYDQVVTEAQIHETSVVEYSDFGAAQDVREICEKTWAKLQEAYPV